jgi:hypothetical protein
MESRFLLTGPRRFGSSMSTWVEPVEVARDAGDDAGVAGSFVVPSALCGVVVQCGDVGELGFAARARAGAVEGVLIHDYVWETPSTRPDRDLMPCPAGARGSASLADATQVVPLGDRLADGHASEQPRVHPHAGIEPRTVFIRRCSSSRPDRFRSKSQRGFESRKETDAGFLKFCRREGYS